ncbi:MAG: N-6 DNA methylase, partial [Treponema sp.]|nr:N-6 DNA methylase [Treponema sp.]
FDVILMNPPYGGSEKEDIKQNFPADLKSSETADLFVALIMHRLKKDGRAAVIIPDGFLFGNDNAKTNLKKRLLTDFNLHTVIRLPQSVFSPYTSITTNILFFNNEEPTGKTWFYRVDIPSDRKHFSKTKPMELKHFNDCVTWWNNRKEITDTDGNPKSKCYTSYELINSNYNFDVCGYPHEEEEILSVSETIQNYEEKRSKLNAEIDSLLSQITELHKKAQRGEL